MSRQRNLGIFAIAMITITSVDTIRNLPATALFGSSLIVFFSVAALFFLIPCALVSAELSSALPETGGVYIWVRKAFGRRFGLLAIWFQWIENVIWYPTILSFITATAAYLISPDLAQNKFFLAALIVIIFWILTVINLYGIKSSAWFSEFCGITGLIIPMVLIISLGFIWFFSGKPIQISFAPEAIMPNWRDPGLLVSLTAVVLTFSGIEIATTHAQDVKNPQRDYPIALLLSVIVIFVTMLLGSLAIAITIPKNELSLVAGIMQAFESFFAAYHLNWLIIAIAMGIIIGSLGSISNWIISPTRGLCIALREENVLHVFHRENKHGAPANLLIAQSVLVTLIAAVFLFMPNVNSSYWVLTVLAAQLYMIMYIIMFAAAMWLRVKHPTLVRPFRVPGGRIGIYVVSGIGILTSVFTLVIGFFPPTDIDVGIQNHYALMLFSGLILMSCPPFLLDWYRMAHLRWVKSARTVYEED